jgi:catechol 2,3-dioxygenase-like lactoylglutathione lyase family enzyme
MAIGIRHSGLVVKDLDKSIAFYGDVLGLKLEIDAVEDGPEIDAVVAVKDVKLRYCKMVCEDNSMIELIQFLSHPGTDFEGNWTANNIGASHICYTVKDIELLHATLTEQGYNCNCTPQVFPNGKVKVMYCHDPDGILVELVEVGDWS